MTKQRIDWAAEAERVAILPDAEIHAELADLIGSLDTADAMDRATGEDRGGFYRDVCSVLSAELRKRDEPRVCRERQLKILQAHIKEGTATVQPCAGGSYVCYFVTDAETRQISG